MAKRGRPSVHTPELAAEICERLAQGEYLVRICEDEHIPARATVHLWVIDDTEGFSGMYARARQAQALHWAEEVVRIADDGTNDCYDTGDGEGKTDHDHIARSRLRVDTRKWLLTKVLPKVYGDKLDVGFPDGIPTIVVTNAEDVDK